MNSLKTFMNKVGERVREVAPQGSIIDGTNPKDAEMEGFVCPTCFMHFSSPEVLEQHYSEMHLDPSANYLCPVCRARLNSQIDLEVHYSSNHGDKDFNNHSLEALREELMELSTNLREERWYSEELKKEVERLQDAFKKKGTEDSDSDIYIHKSQLDAVEESKSLLSSEVVLLRKQLTEALGKSSSLRNEKDILEQRASDFAVERAELRATLDSLQAEKVGLESQLHDATCNISALEISRKDEKDKLCFEMVKLQDSYASKAKECQSQKEKEMTLQQDLKLKLELSAELKEEMRNLKMDFDLMKKQLQEKIDEASVYQLKIKEQEQQLSQVNLSLPEVTPIETQQNQGCVEDQQIGEKEEKSFDDAMKLHIEELNNKIKEIEHLNIQLIESEKCKLRAEELAREKLKWIDDLQDSLSDSQKSLQEKDNQISKFELALKEKDQTIDLLNDKIEEIFDLRKELEQEKELLSNAKNEINLHNVTIAGLEKDIENYIAQVEDLSNYKLKTVTELKTTQEDLSKELLTKESMELKLGSLVQSLNENEVTMKALNDTICSLNSKEKNLNVMLSTNMNEIQDLKSLAESLRSEKLSLERELEIMQNKCMVSENEAKSYAEQHNNLHNHIAQLKKELQETREKANNTLAELKHQISVFQHEENIIKEENKCLQNKMKEFEDDNKQLLIKEQEYHAEVNTLKQHIKANEESSMKINESLNKLKKEKNEIEERNLLATKEVDYLQTELQKLEAEFNKEHGRISELEGRIAAQEAEMAGLSGDKLELEVKVEAASEEQKSLVERCVAAEAEVERLQQQLTQLRRKLDDSTAALHELGRENQSLQMETAKLSERKWAEDSEVIYCLQCNKNFSMTVRRHHCRNCLQIFCNDCSSKQASVEQNKSAVRVCDSCFTEITSKI